MRILLTGDFHVTKGIKTNICLNFLDYIHQYYKENDLDYIYVLGDVFDRSSSIKNEAFIPLFMKLYQMKNDGVNFLFILGNHDIINVDNDSLVETFEPIGKVIKEGGTALKHLGCGDEENYFLPYTKDDETIPHQGRYLFTHLPIADFSFDNAYHATEKHAFKKSLFEEFNLVFSGHFHRHQVQKNIVYVGSPFQQNRGEIGHIKGFVVLYDEEENWDFVEYNEAPKYINFSVEDIPNINNIDFRNTFVVVKVDRKIKDFAKLRFILYEKGALDIIPIFETIDETIEINSDEIEVNESIEDVVREVIMSFDIEHIDNKRLLNLFEKVLVETK